MHRCELSLIFREAPWKLLLEHNTFYCNFEISLIWIKIFPIYCMLFLINLPEMKGKSPWCPFETYYMYANDDLWSLMLLYGKKFFSGKTLGSHLMQETYNRWPELQKVLCWYQNFVPKGVYAPAPGLHTCIKTWKICIKSEFKEFYLKQAKNDRSDKRFLLISKFCPQGVVCPCPRAMYMY